MYFIAFSLHGRHPIGAFHRGRRSQPPAPDIFPAPDRASQAQRTIRKRRCLDRREAGPARAARALPDPLSRFHHPRQARRLRPGGGGHHRPPARDDEAGILPAGVNASGAPRGRACHHVTAGQAEAVEIPQRTRVPHDDDQGDEQAAGGRQRPARQGGSGHTGCARQAQPDSRTPPQAVAELAEWRCNCGPGSPCSAPGLGRPVPSTGPDHVAFPLVASGADGRQGLEWSSWRPAWAAQTTLLFGT
jgi:hypothetical protein